MIRLSLSFCAYQIPGEDNFTILALQQPKTTASSTAGCWTMLSRSVLMLIKSIASISRSFYGVADICLSHALSEVKLLCRPGQPNPADSHCNWNTVVVNLQALCNGVPPSHDSFHKVNIKYEYSVRTNRLFSQYWLNKQYCVAEVIHCSLVDID